MGVTCTCPREDCAIRRGDAVVLVPVNIAEARDRYWEKRAARRDRWVLVLILGLTPLPFLWSFSTYAYSVLMSW